MSKRATMVAAALATTVLLAGCGSSSKNDAKATASSVQAAVSSALDNAKQTASSLQASASSALDNAKQTASSLLAAASSAVAGTGDISGSWKLGLDVLGGNVAADLQPTITFDNGNVSGFSGCNSYTGTYTVSGNDLTLGPLGGTKKACGPAATVVENAYLGRLNQVKSYALRDGKLVLRDASSTPVLIFSKG